MPGRVRSKSALARRTRVVATVVLGALTGFVAVPTIWLWTDALEQDNNFCISCHLAEGLPLHLEARLEFGAVPPVNLAGVHGASAVEARLDSLDVAFRCIDCHGGTSLVGRARVKALAAKDLFWYSTGYFDEPQEMTWPLQEADCRKCHGEFRIKAREFEERAFHDTPLHNEGLGVACVECHQVHLPGDANNYYLDPRHTRKQCARCHADLFD